MSSWKMKRAGSVASSASITAVAVKTVGSLIFILSMKAASTLKWKLVQNFKKGLVLACQPLALSPASGLSCIDRLLSRDIAILALRVDSARSSSLSVLVRLPGAAGEGCTDSTLIIGEREAETSG